MEHCLPATDWLETIRTERERQISKGKTPEFDDRVNEDGELIDKACYMLDVSSGSKTIWDYATLNNIRFSENYYDRWVGGATC